MEGVVEGVFPPGRNAEEECQGGKGIFIREPHDGRAREGHGSGGGHLLLFADALAKAPRCQGLGVESRCCASFTFSYAGVTLC